VAAQAGEEKQYARCSRKGESVWLTLLHIPAAPPANRPRAARPIPMASGNVVLILGLD
jgi:hypothetical protein